MSKADRRRWKDRPSSIPLLRRESGGRDEGIGISEERESCPTSSEEQKKGFIS